MAFHRESSKFSEVMRVSSTTKLIWVPENTYAKRDKQDLKKKCEAFAREVTDILNRGSYTHLWFIKQSEIVGGIHPSGGDRRRHLLIRFKGENGAKLGSLHVPFRREEFVISEATIDFSVKGRRVRKLIVDL